MHQERIPQKEIEQERSNTNSYPSVTIGIPVLNEEEHIERVISGFLNSEYPNLVEILIADGGSTDKTRKIVANLSKKDGRVKLIDNPDKFQSFGLNRMIQIAKGEVFLRADGHCYYNNDYIEKCVEVMQKTGARNVGGAQRYKASNNVQAGIALAVKSFLGNGGAKYMDESYEGFGDTVFLGCFRTEDLRKIGGFNTENITNQDSELNLRLIEEFGQSVYISPKIKSWYFPRDTFWKLFKQYFRYGRGRFLTRVLHPKSSPIRGMIPFLFVMILTTYVILDIVVPIRLHSEIVLLGLLLILVFESSKISISKRALFKSEIWQKEGASPGIISNIVMMAICLVLMQIGHFLGFLYQLIKSVARGKKAWVW